MAKKLQNYVLINSEDGFIYGVLIASDPVEACRLLDEEIGWLDFEYSLGFSNANSHGYIVHEAPADFDVKDGTNEGDIERASEFPIAATVEVRVR